MSTGKTPVYDLHQWAGSDAVSRTEMNENFLALEEALVDHRPHMLLYSTTTASDASRVSITLPTIDWGDYMEIVMTIHDAQTSELSPVTVSIYVNEVTGATSGYHCKTSYSSSELPGIAYTDVAYGLVRLHVCRDPQGQVRASAYRYDRSSTGWNRSLTWQNVTKILFQESASSTIHAGTVIKLWGVQ